jgi:hypothetical protein
VRPDARGGRVADAHGMKEVTVPVHLELKIGEALTGRAIYAAGTVRSFQGFIGLLAALDALVEDVHEGRVQLHPETPAPAAPDRSER